MSQTLVTSPPALVVRSRLRVLLALACILILGLVTAVVALATSDGTPPAHLAPAKVTSSSAGARPDHRGLHDGLYVNALGETGARLDHRGLKVRSSSPHPAAR
jgi:hypothetical protein